MFGAWRRFQTERNYLLQVLVNKKQQINDDAKQTISKTRSIGTSLARMYKCNKQILGRRKDLFLFIAKFSFFQE